MSYPLNSPSSRMNNRSLSPRDFRGDRVERDKDQSMVAPPPASKRGAHRQPAQSLEALAISQGIIESPASSHPLIMRLRDFLRGMGVDGQGFAELQRRMSVLDSDGSHTLNEEELKICLNKLQVGLSDREAETIFRLFADETRPYLDTDDFLTALRGAQTAWRRDLVRRAFRALDVSGQGFVGVERVIERFDPTQHPLVRRGEQTAQQVFRAFMRACTAGRDVEDAISLTEFENHYANVSAAVPEDDFFVALVRDVWRLSVDVESDREERKTSRETERWRTNMNIYGEGERDRDLNRFGERDLLRSSCGRDREEDRERERLWETSRNDDLPLTGRRSVSPSRERNRERERERRGERDNYEAYRNYSRGY